MVIETTHLLVTPDDLDSETRADLVRNIRCHVDDGADRAEEYVRRSGIGASAGMVYRIREGRANEQG